MPEADRHALLLVLIFTTNLAGCASGRDIRVSGDPIELKDGESYYIAVPEMTEKVVYGLVPHPIDYSKYSGRKDIPAKPDVPEQISEYLHKKGQLVTIGPVETTYDSVDVVVSYVELWGWDIRPIIKTLEIEFLSQSDSRRSIVEFSELTFFNSQPTAKSLVPQMLDRLFQITD